ncbi:Recombinase [Facklamia miroungae]|uniref:Recombinase n=1 Tax=Facklamia miroungae TaxID=120956 RepID=A0A1G7TCW8_9LACT|nr:Recombinase [Facklamia miroungae]
MINEKKATVVRQIFDWVLEGNSIVDLRKQLEQHKIASLRGKAKWSKRALKTMLNNEKYIGHAHLFKDNDNDDDGSYLSRDKHPAIISENTFEMVQEEKQRRSNLVRFDGGKKKRKNHKYSSTK